MLDEIEKNPELKKLRVAFLIDEAHRSQEGQMGAAIRLPFRARVNPADEPDAEAPELDPQEQLAKIIREHDLNQMIVAFTATPAPASGICIDVACTARRYLRALRPVKLRDWEEVRY